MPASRPVSILIVDDEPDICANLSDIFSDLGFQVGVAYEGFTALEMIRERPYDIALLDLKMPGMDGLELFQRIRELRVGTVAVIVTAFATEATARAALDAGAWHVIPKPVDTYALLQLVEEAAGKPLVMVVDDDPDLCDALLDIFQDHGFRASVAYNVGEAGRRMQASHLDVAVIDMRLPEGDGSQVLKLVRDTNPEARVVVITGHREQLHDLLQQVIAEGVDAVCYKPFDVNSLLDTVKRLAR